MSTKVSEVLGAATEYEDRTWSWQWFALRKTDRLLCDQSPTLFWLNALSGVRECGSVYAGSGFFQILSLQQPNNTMSRPRKLKTSYSSTITDLLFFFFLQNQLYEYKGSHPERSDKCGGSAVTKYQWWRGSDLQQSNCQWRNKQLFLHTCCYLLDQ
jgi:hypothetical protein